MFNEDIGCWKLFHRGLAEQSRFLKCKPAKEVDHPTNEVVGEIERVDQRDTVQSRLMMKDKNSSEYKDYYARRPERKEVDDHMRANLTTAPTIYSGCTTCLAESGTAYQAFVVPVSGNLFLIHPKVFAPV
jgi:hypothetical protein